MVLLQQMCVIYPPLEFESQSESERCLAAFFFFPRRVNRTEGRRVNKLKHMWTLQSHNIDSLVGRALIIDADRFLAFFILYIIIFFCETDCQKAANLTKKNV